MGSFGRWLRQVQSALIVSAVLVGCTLYITGALEAHGEKVVRAMDWHADSLARGRSRGW